MTHEKLEVNLDEGTGPDGRMTMAEARAATIQPPYWRDRAYVLMPPWLVGQTPTLNEPDEFGELEYIDADDPIACARWFSAVAGPRHWPGSRPRSPTESTRSRVPQTAPSPLTGQRSGW